ncbi:MAG: diaminopimelate epimerase [Thermoleophilia bacterium]|nr:diaminopimelate epimerase [Thermoleophilia bacterium]
MDQVNFSKWHGIGNDYIIIAAQDLDFTMTPARARAICDRNFGIGADGILLWSGTESGRFRLDIFNPDGSVAEMCGNGIRMLASYLSKNGLAREETIAVETKAGIIASTVLVDGNVRVHMGQARLGGLHDNGYAGAGGGGETGRLMITAAGRELTTTFVDMGNPHCVIEVDDLENIDMQRLGPAIENHEIFPNRANVEFMQIMGPREVKMRVWERGVGETNACGTGACAVAVAAYRLRGAGSPTTVHLPGGDLLIEVEPGMDVYMTGSAEDIYTGAMSEDFVVKLKGL